MTAVLESLKGDLVKSLEVACLVAAKAEQEGRDFSAEERSIVTKAMEDARAIKDQIQAKQGDADLIAAVKGFGDSVDLAPSGDGTKSEPAPAGEGDTLGGQFVESEAFKAWMGQVAPGGHVPESTKGLQSPPVQFKDLIRTGGTDSAGVIKVQPDRQPLVPFARKPLTLRDVVTKGRTTSDTIEFTAVLAETNNAAPIPEAQSSAVIGDGTGGTTTAALGGRKPESGMTFEKRTVTVKTIAHWMPATKKSLSDAAQIRTLIDNFLLYGLEEELEDQMANGNGTGENLVGIANTSGIQVHARGADDLLTAYRKAKTKVRVVGRASATAYLMHPNDAEDLDLLRDNEGRFYFGGPGEDGVQRLWRLPVIESEAIPEGTQYVGDFRQCVLFDREQASIQVSDSHADFFVRNMIAILAEMRAAFAIIRPPAIVRVTA